MKHNKGFILESIIRYTVPYVLVFGIGFGCGYLYARQDHIAEPTPEKPKRYLVNDNEDQELLRLFREAKEEIKRESYGGQNF